MFDVLHVFFEDDVTPHYEKHMEVRSAVRSSLYSELYGRRYKYAVKTSAQQQALGFDPTMELPDGPPESKAIKPYIPPTDPMDLPGILDAPLN